LPLLTPLNKYTCRQKEVQLKFSYTNPSRNTRVEDDDEDEDTSKTTGTGAKRKPYQQYEYTYSAQHYHFYLSEEIGDPNLYADMIHKISAATANDTVFIHLNTPGGQLDTGVQIINAMQNSQAKVVTILESMAYSLGTLLFLAGDEMIVNDHCLIMFHNFKGGVIGKGNELTSQLEATIKWFSSLAKKIYLPFLTEDEFARITRGEDLWMQSPEIRKRLDKMVKADQTPVSPVPKKTKTAKAAKPEVPANEVHTDDGLPVKPKKAKKQPAL
jgi:ATP-dependent protease ClpP protease subunit